MKVLVTSISILFLGCQAAPPQGEAAPAQGERSGAEATASMAGELHVGGRRVRIVPFVFHPYEMDLRVRGLIDRDRARKAGDEASPLAFDEDRRSTPPTDIRVEYVMGFRVSHGMQLLTTSAEAAHFLIEATGSIYQILDTEHAARRDGEIRPKEIRILSGNTGGTNTLVGALREHYGPLRLEQVDLQKPSEPPPSGELHPARSSP